MTNYAKGRRFEWRVRDYLEGLGWTVFRMAGSKTKVDLIAFAPREPFSKHSDCAHFIQCKAKGAFGTAERAQFLKVVGDCDVIGLLACAPKRTLEMYWAGDRKSSDRPFLLSPQSKHATNCDYHADQYEHECTCGLTRKAA